MKQTLDMSSSEPLSKVVLHSIFTSVSRSVSTFTSSRAIRMAWVSTYFERKADALDGGDPHSVEWGAEQRWEGRMFFNVHPTSLADLMAYIKVRASLTAVCGHVSVAGTVPSAVNSSNLVAMMHTTSQVLQQWITCVGESFVVSA
jgi:hypothetical protein